MDVNELIEIYMGVWGEPERERRLALLEQAWAEDGVYADPSAHVAGRTALADHIGGVLRRFPGARFALPRVVGEIPSAMDPPRGCAFHPRCPDATARCAEAVPETVDLGGGRRVACHLFRRA